MWCHVTAGAVPFCRPDPEPAPAQPWPAPHPSRTGRSASETGRSQSQSDSPRARATPPPAGSQATSCRFGLRPVTPLGAVSSRRHLQVESLPKRNRNCAALRAWLELAKLLRSRRRRAGPALREMQSKALPPQQPALEKSNAEGRKADSVAWWHAAGSGPRTRDLY